MLFSCTALTFVMSCTAVPISQGEVQQDVSKWFKRSHLGILYVVQAQLVGHTSGMVLDRLEEIHSALTRLVWQHRHNSNRKQAIQEAEVAAQAMLQHATSDL